MKIVEFPIEDKIHLLKDDNLYRLVKIKGIAVQLSDVIPYFEEYWLKCNKCGATQGPIFTKNDSFLLHVN
jgi:DNA replicative helicase MCM subunit Mcm2 (Cdc46/Mcm family)